MRPCTPLYSKIAISLFMAASIDLSFIGLVVHSGCVRDDLIILIYPGKPADFQARKPGFLPAHKPGFTGLKIGGFSGTRVAIPTVG